MLQGGIQARFDVFCIVRCTRNIINNEIKSICWNGAGQVKLSKIEHWIGSLIPEDKKTKESRNEWRDELDKFRKGKVLPITGKMDWKGKAFA